MSFETAVVTKDRPATKHKGLFCCFIIRWPVTDRERSFGSALGLDLEFPRQILEEQLLLLQLSYPSLKLVSQISDF